MVTGDPREARQSGGSIGLSLCGCAVALVGLLLTIVETDSGWSDAIWSDRSWSWLAWSITGVGVLAAGFALIEALKLPRRNRRILIALAVEALAAIAWIAIAFAATAT